MRSAAVHNGVARFDMIRLDAAGNAVPALVLLLPVGQLGELAKALWPIAK